MMMMSSRLSRWTPLFFVCALANLLAAEGLIVAGLTWPTQAISTPGTLVAVHLLTVGWLLLLMLGALFQFVPVITSKPLVSQRIALVTLVAVQGGLIGMICGFSRLGGESSVHAVALPTGGAAVLVGVLIASWNIGVPLLRARPMTLPGRMILTALAFLLVTVMLGLSFALALTVPALTPDLAPLLARVGDHALAGLGGWFTLAAMGVSYKLLTMFMLAPEERGIAGDCVHVLGAAGFALTVGAGLAAIWLPAQLPRVGEMIGYGAIASAVVIYLWDVLRIYRTRKRAVIEAHNRAAVGAFVLLGIATGLGVGFLGSGTLEVGGPVVVFLVLFGWLGGLGLTQLYKIVPFLTWLSRYGSSLGRGAVPRVQDLVKESRSYPWFSSYFLGAFIATLAVLIGWLQAFRACFALMTIATVGLAIEYWRAWRGSYVHPTPAVPAAPPFLSIKEVDRD
ncbi:MAG TPA: hypothetical protein VIC29_06915 [Steroidobacteraceae bacterium]|jgi:hypothetical protein